MTLTERRIRDAKPRASTYVPWDEEVKGLGCRVTPAGSKSFILNYRVHGRQCRATIARCREIPLREAREHAGAEMVRIRDGQPDLLQRQRKAQQAPTIAEFIELAFETEMPARIERGRIRASTVAGYRWQSAKYIVPAIGKQRVQDVTRANIECMVARLPKVTRNRVLALTSRLFTLAETWELRSPGSNPARRVERAREQARDRVLSPEELAALASAMKDAEDRAPVCVAVIRFAAVTGLRIGEVLAIRWEHVDLAEGRLLLPETKTGRRWHDLPSAAQAVLAATPRASEWAFSNTGSAPASYSYVRTTFHRVAKAAGLEDVRLHDLRRTVMTRAAAAGVGTHVLRDLLGHKTTAMADRYVRDLANPVRDAREKVGAEIDAMMQGGSAEVVPLRRSSNE